MCPMFNIEMDEKGEHVAKKMKLVAEETAVTQYTHCQYWVQRKKRFCKMTVGNGKKFCGEHSVDDSLSPDSNRVPCPLDPKHTVDKARLEKHLLICNSKKPTELPAYIKPQCNVGDPPSDSDKVFRLQDVAQVELDGIVKKIEELFEKHIAGMIKTKIMTHEILADELANETYGSDKRKHLLQTSSILGIMQHEDFLEPETCFIEFGAGKAALTYWLANAIKDLKDSKVLVIDRASHRHKKDNLIRDRDLVERIRVDIADLNLRGLETNCKSFVGLSKHLCGAATDLTLRCIVQGNQQKLKTRSFIICLCCHHRCSWGTFVGKDWLLANGIDKRTFDVMIKVVSWFTCGDGHNRNKRDKTDERETEKKEKEEVGWKCKRLIDHARMQFMLDHGYDITMSFYAEQEVTLENVCLIGKLKI